MAKKKKTVKQINYFEGIVSAIRIFLGVWFLHHGVTKFLFRPEIWPQLGSAMQNLGIGFYPAFWGFMAVLVFVLGGTLLALGVYSRIAAGFLAFNMLVALIMHLLAGHGFGQLSLLFLIILIALIITDGGAYKLQK